MNQSAGYDVFLSYNTRDHVATETVARWLRENGVSCFLDRWELIPGRPWQPALEQALAQCNSVAILIGPGDLGRWQQREQSVALDRQASAGVPVIPVLLPGADPPLGFLSLNTWIDLRGGPDDERGLKLLDAAIRGTVATEVDEETVRNEVCPFRGLLPYREEDAPFFFGRDGYTRQLVELIQQHSFVMVLGASGSGKSSVVRAGLSPQLRRAENEVWEIVKLVPTDRPLHALAEALLPLLEPAMTEIDRLREIRKLAKDFAECDSALRDVSERISTKQPGTTRMLLVIDQWEELYTLCPKREVTKCFVDQLLNASGGSNLTIVGTCRADFYGRVSEHRAMVDRIQAAQITVGPMNASEVQEVIEAPARTLGLEFEAGLTKRILADVGQESGRLPLLSFLLEQLWQQRRGALLTNEAYDSIGGVEGAIAGKAEALYERLSDKQRELLPKIFMQLISVGEESEDTRRRAKLSTIGGEARPVVDLLADARLVVTNADESSETMEVAHEALIRGWKRLQGWVDSARGFLIWRKRLAPFVETWAGDSQAVLRHGQLAEAERWLELRQADLDEDERRFIEVSIREREVEEQGKIRRRRQLVWITTSALIGFFLAVFFSGYAWWLRGIAEENANKAIHNAAVSLANQSTAVRTSHPQRSVLLAAHAIKICRDNNLSIAVAAEQSLRDSSHYLGGLGMSGHEDSVSSVAIGPQGRWLVTGSRDNTARLWDLQAEQPEKSARVLCGHEDLDVYSVAIGPQGRWLVTGSRDNTARLWDLQAEQPEKSARLLSGHEGSVLSVVIGPASRWLVTGSGDNTARLWDLQAQQPEKSARVLSGHHRPVYSVAIGPQGRWLVTGSGDDTARLWDLQAQQPEKSARVLSGHEAYVYSVAIGPQGRWLVTGSFDNTARLWDLQAEQPEKSARVLSGHEDLVYSVAIGPQGRWLVTGSEDNTARLWDLQAQQPEKSARVLSGHDASVYTVAIGPQGRWLVTGSGDNTARLWDLQAEQPEKSARVLSGNDASVHSVASGPEGLWLSSVVIGPQGRWLVTGSRDNTARLWDLQAQQPEESARVLRGHVVAVSSVAIGPQGRWLVTGSFDDTARLWDLQAQQPEKSARVLRGHEHSVDTVAIGPQGRWLVTGSWDHTARLWDLQADQPEKSARVLRGHEHSVDTVAIGPQGRWLVTGSVDNTARLWDLQAQQPEESARVLRGHEDLVSSVAIGPQGRWLVTGSSDNTARLWDLQVEQPEKSARVLSGHGSPVTSVAIGPQGRWLVTGSEDNTARLWDLQAEQPEKSARVLSGHGSPVTSVAIGPQGRWLVTGSEDNTARLWDLQAEQPEKSARVLSGHEHSVHTVAIGPQGRWVVTGSRDNTARLWDLQAEQPEKSARVLRGHDASVYTVAIGPQGRWLVTGSEDTTARLWPLRLSDVFEQAERSVGRNFTLKEWEELFPDEPYRKTFPDLPFPYDYEQ